MDIVTTAAEKIRYKTFQAGNAFALIDTCDQPLNSNEMEMLTATQAITGVSKPLPVDVILNYWQSSSLWQQY